MDRLLGAVYLTENTKCSRIVAVMLASVADNITTKSGQSIVLAGLVTNPLQLCYLVTNPEHVFPGNKSRTAIYLTLQKSQEQLLFLGNRTNSYVTL